MKVWIVEWRYPTDAEFSVTVWGNEQDALQQACKEMKQDVDGWDIDNPDIEMAAEQINDFLQQGQLRKALKRFNDYQDDYNFDYAQYWFVEEKDVLNNSTSNSPTIPAPAMPYQATTAGATCRKCNTPNEYAYADKPDGTYCCRQCKTFSSIFGVS